MSTSTVRLNARVPANDAFMIFAVVVAGFAAAAIADARLWYATPILVIVLLLSGQRSPANDVSESAMPDHINALLAETLASLPAGPTRVLFTDVTAAAMPVFTYLRLPEDDRYDHHTRASVCELLESSARVAKDLARLEFATRSGVLMQRDPAARESAERARDLQIRQLTDVAATLNGLVASDLARGTRASDRVDELVTEIRAQTKARTEAWQEIDAMLSAR